MPYRPEAELKRPDLKGEFLCGHCGKTFCHAASLNRHRLNFHGDDQHCLVCDKKIPHNDTIRRHMQSEHDIQRVFTCGCCNWTFPDKKELHSHNNSMMKSGTPGDAKVIAVSSRRPGSLSQHELRGEERTPRTKKRCSKGDSQSESLSGSSDSDQFLSLIAGLLSQQAQATAQQQATVVEEPAPSLQLPSVPASWVNSLLAVNPALYPLFPMQSSSASSTTSSSSEMEMAPTPEPSSLETVLSSIMNNNEGESSSSRNDGVTSGAEEENIDVADDGKDQLVKAVGADFLLVKTETPISNSFTSGTESGIGSGPVSNTPSPASSSPPATSDTSPETVTDLVADMVQKAKRANKRRSIDDICFNLVCKKSLFNF
ncbi:hypothetical protein GCK72_010238 [Caenorhabditis remanei]|uniref:C2H2-type domain-containing protein n=1 Tax=Caenorhabditis remanei TaxID=31234 RepID=A0A6A5H2Q7_CAERE|nr:hypothetical protein GCK72_010238 [Caenorhabditis remanei]KAF1761978.1 hypothetical protein GCK72_010238 [Caenorhabditis remanei]